MQLSRLKAPEADRDPGQTAINLRAEAVAEQHGYIDGVRVQKPHNAVDWGRVDTLVRLAGDYSREAMSRRVQS